jgi:hypothetical protein
VPSQISRSKEKKIPHRSAFSGLSDKVVNDLRYLTGNAYFAYLTILLLQIRVTWGMWLFRDLTHGDTRDYFFDAYRWFQTGITPITWSPLYIWFYGSLLHVSPDAFVVTTLHRWLILRLWYWR